MANYKKKNVEKFLKAIDQIRDITGNHINSYDPAYALRDAVSISLFMDILNDIYKPEIINASKLARKCIDIVSETTDRNQNFTLGSFEFETYSHSGDRLLASNFFPRLQYRIFKIVFPELDITLKNKDEVLISARPVNIGWIFSPKPSKESLTLLSLGQ